MTAARINQEAYDALTQACDVDGLFHSSQVRRTLSMLSPTEPEPGKWQPKTRGGYEFEIFAERDGKLWGRINLPVGWCPMDWDSDGAYFRTSPPREYGYDLLPANPHAELIERASSHLAGVSSCMDSRTEKLIRDLIDALEAAGDKP